MTKENLLVTLADKNYIDQAKQLFSSVYWNAGWKGDYMLLAHEIPEKDLKWFRNKGILIKKCKPLYDKKIGKNKYPPVVLDKFYLFTPEFKKWKHVIFLDADIIVRASLDKLTKVKGFGAVQDKHLPIIKLFEHDHWHKQILFNEIKKKYNIKGISFNAGVFSFKTKMVEKDLFTRLINFWMKYNSICYYNEQTVFNIFFKDKFKKFVFKYNIWPFCLNFFYGIPNENINGYILHFVCIDNPQNSKPWNPKNPFYKEWKYNLDRAELIDLNNIPKGKKWKFRKN